MSNNINNLDDIIADIHSDHGASILGKLGYKCKTKVIKIVDVPKLVQVETKNLTLPISLLANVDKNATTDVETQLNGIVAFLGLVVMGMVYAIVYCGVQ